MPRRAGSSAVETVAIGPPRHGLAFSDFVDDALFHPRWGYYGTGNVRFGTGGHYDTYPLAISPLFGQMLAHYAFRVWRRAASPSRFEICELGAGNGQLCLDTLLWVRERGRHDSAWKRLAAGLRYRIIERSPALIERQRQQMGPLAEAVIWTRADPSRRLPRGAPFATHGVIVANEVLDCLPHHKVVPRRNGVPATAYVVASLNGRPLSRAQLAEAMASGERRRRVRFCEVLVPIDRVPRLAAFVRRHHPELMTDGASRPPYFAAPRLPALMANTAHFYRHADALWIDYGEQREFHRRAPESKRLFAGVPRSGARVYDDPGRDDITFLVDFSAAMSAARQAGWSVAFYGPQSELARRTQVSLDSAAIERIIRHRALRWMLALAGVGPEGSWQRPAISWSRAHTPTRVPVRRYVEQSVQEFCSDRTLFKLLIVRK